MKLRITITIIVLFLYGIAFNFYIYWLLTSDYLTSTLIYNWTTLLMLSFCVFDWKLGFVNNFHKQLNFVGFLSLMVNYAFIVLTHHKIITQSVYMFLTFNSGIFLVTAFIFISATRHDMFDH